MSPYRSLSAYDAPPARGSDHGANFQLTDLIILIESRRKVILRVTLITVALAIFFALSLPTVWSSAAVVMMDARKNNVTDISAVLSQLPGDPATLQNQIQILTSRDLAQKVIDQLKLDNDPEFNPLLARPGLSQIASELAGLLNPRNWFDDGAGAAGGEGMHDRVLANFASHVRADANGLSTAITITVTSRDPVKAARIANTLAAAYVGEQVELKRGAAGATTTWLDQRIHDLAQQLQIQEGAVQSYKAQHGLTDTAPGNSLVDQQLVGINTQIVTARSDVAEKQAIYDRISQLVQSGNAADVSSVVSSPLIVQLRTQEAQLLRDEGDLSSKYGPLHPKLQALEEQKRDLDTKIAEEVRRIAAAAGNDLTVAKAHLASLQDSLGSAKGDLTGENYARVQLQALESNAASTRAQYEAFVTRLRQTQDQDSVAAPESRIISKAEVPLSPTSPKRALIVAASLPLGLMLGLLAALCMEKFGTILPIRVEGSRGPARAALMPPVYRPRAEPAPPPPYRPRGAGPPRAKPKPKPAALPAPVWRGPPILGDVGSITLKSGDAMLDDPTSRYAHSMAGLVRQLKSKTDGAAIIAVTAAEKSESKSAVALSVARAAAMMGKKVILLDCDPSQTSASVMHVKADKGIYDILGGQVALNQALVKDHRSDAYVLAMNRQPPNLPTMFSSNQMSRLMGVLRDGCEMVVIDCARASAGPEAALIARLADATLVVSKQTALYASGFAKTVEVLEAAHAAPIGIVTTR